MRKIAPALALAVVTACSGDVHMSQLDTGSGTNLPADGIEGVVIYPPVLFKEVFRTTLLVNEKNEILGRAPGGCESHVQEKLVMRADLDHPQVISYDAGLLETNKFGVTISDGLLTGVNTESNPERGATFGTVAAGIAALGVLLYDGTTEEPPENACNSGLVFDDLVRCEGMACPSDVERAQR